ncbi:MAG: DNA-processing protein DprA [Planctomycetota bacterium]|jgi:DNA processing protein|nr:DNA-processing protein DprA [Planctomycetota bacterium]
MSAPIERRNLLPLRLARGGPSWPRILDQIPSPPEDLWVLGKAELLGLQPAIAIVGTRSPTEYGRAQAERFGAGLARAGMCVISGLARGIDSAAHRGALGVGGQSLAVLGSAVDMPWPRGPLTDRMAREGLLISEYPPGTGARRHHFPMRNRLISGLADAVLVVEAAHASGSLITARWAADQGRDVYVIPGRVDHPMARGCLRLIREGGTPVGSPEQLLEDLYGFQLAPKTGKVTPTPPGGGAGNLLQALEGETLCVDELAQRLDRRVDGTLGLLVQLELEGWVRRGPGGLYGLHRPLPQGES